MLFLVFVITSTKYVFFHSILEDIRLFTFIQINLGFYLSSGEGVKLMGGVSAQWQWVHDVVSMWI